jgi:15-cis-phytoene synthase
MEIAPFLAAVPTEQRLALAYAGSGQHPVLLGFFALDARLAAIVRGASEPLLGQVQLAWWRDQLALPSELRPRGEPLLALLGAWQGEGASLSALVDGWELLLDSGPLDRTALAAHAEARARGWAALARLAGAPAHADEAQRAGRNWAAVDLAMRLGQGDEHAAARALAEQQDWRPLRLPRSLRPLAVLHGLARRRRGQAELLDGPLALGAALRLGLFGA